MTKKSDIIKEKTDKNMSYHRFLLAYNELVADIASLKKEQKGLHQEILAAIDQQKMDKILSRINKTKVN